MILSKDSILSCDDLKTEVVAVPEWGGDVMVRGLDATARDKFEQSNFTRKGKGNNTEFDINVVNMRARLVALCVVDEHGVRMFNGKDVEALGLKSASAINRLFEVAQRLSGLTKADVEELEGNSEADPSGDSTSA